MVLKSRVPDDGACSQSSVVLIYMMYTSMVGEIKKFQLSNKLIWKGECEKQVFGEDLDGVVTALCIALRRV